MSAICGAWVIAVVGVQEMRWRPASRTEFAVIGLIVAVLVALVGPTPHWREAISESCSLCGNRRVTIEHYRWWRLRSVREEWVTSYAIPDGHSHDWWKYSHTFSSWSKKWASDESSRYRDGGLQWAPRPNAQQAAP